MWHSLLTRVVCSLLKRSDLSLENRNRLTVHILALTGALPIHDTIVVSENDEVLINGIALDAENERRLRLAARSLLDNPAKEFVYQQLLKTAVNHGIFKAETEKQIFWARAAIWWGQTERELLIKLAGNSPS